MVVEKNTAFGRLKGKVAIVTGAASGIGRASALLFAEEGAHVLAADIAAGGLGETLELLRRSDPKAESLEVDVTKAEDVRRMIEKARQTLGGLDILFNNAGIEGDFVPISECTEENWDRTLAVNLKGVFLGIKYGAHAMVEQGGGVIINTASVAGLVGVRNFAAYAASKGGVIQLTRTAALEYARQGVRVNCICPGMIDTPLTARLIPDEETRRAAAAQTQPLQRIGQPEDIARAALYLASDDASFATGTALVVDGAYTAQ